MQLKDVLDKYGNKGSFLFIGRSDDNTQIKMLDDPKEIEKVTSLSVEGYDSESFKKAQKRYIENLTVGKYKEPTEYILYDKPVSHINSCLQESLNRRDKRARRQNPNKQAIERFTRYPTQFRNKG